VEDSRSIVNLERNERTSFTTRDGSTFKSTSDAFVYSSATYTDADGVTDGFNLGSTLNATGHFQLYALRFQPTDYAGGVFL